LNDPRGLALDWVNRKLYYVDAGTDQIAVTSLDGKHHQVIVHRDLDQPHDIKVDPESG
jgi:integrin beta 2